MKLVKRDGANDPSSGVLPTAGSDPPRGPPKGIETGVELDGKYRVGAMIGSGSFGIVYEAENIELGEKVAIKCLRGEMLENDAVIARFAREAKAAAAIKSEYVASVHDVGTSEEGMPYIVMEYLQGRDLTKVLADEGRLSPGTAVEYTLQVCEALAAAHGKGIIHRDIKPENLLLTERDGGMRIIKVLDFGISKAVLTGSIFGNALPAVQTTDLMGTPLYMSPEQVRRSDVADARSDIWSLGLVLYEMLAGAPAFDEGSLTEVCAAILETEPRKLSLQRPDLPAGLVDVVARCLEKEPVRRFQNVAELAIALLPFGPKRTRLNVERAIATLKGAGLIDLDVEVESVIVQAIVLPAVAPSSAAATLPSTPRPRGRTRGLVVAVVGTASVTLLVASAMNHRSHEAATVSFKATASATPSPGPAPSPAPTSSPEPSPSASATGIPAASATETPAASATEIPAASATSATPRLTVSPVVPTPQHGSAGRPIPAWNRKPLVAAKIAVASAQAPMNDASPPAETKPSANPSTTTTGRTFRHDL